MVKNSTKKSIIAVGLLRDHVESLDRVVQRAVTYLEIEVEEKTFILSIQVLHQHIVARS